MKENENKTQNAFQKFKKEWMQWENGISWHRIYAKYETQTHIFCLYNEKKS